jgi:hypothetical protein
MVKWATDQDFVTFEIGLPLLLTAVGIPLALYRYRQDRTGAPYLASILFLLPALASLVFWFFAAPDPRYAGSAFWLLGAGVLLVAGEKLCTQRPSGTTAVVFLLLAAFTLGEKIGKNGAFVAPGPQQGFYPVPTAEVHVFVTKSGLSLYVPNNGDRCWDAALPCTPYPNPHLRLRKNGEINSGFTVLGPAVTEQEISHQLDARLGGSIRLRGYKLDTQSTASGQALRVTLYWQATQSIPKDYTVFVQVLDGAGMLVTQKDNQPVEGTYPTSVWQVGAIIPDTYLVPILPQMSAGDYRLIAGMYLYPSLERLPVAQDGQPGKDFVDVAIISLPL